MSLACCTCVGAADNAPAQKAPAAQSKSFIAAYYFHGNFRCATCKKIEQYSREAIELNFAQQLKSGALVFQPINIDEPENQHFVQDYQLVTRSLVLVKYENGKQTAWKNLPAVWQNVGDQQAFFNYVKTEVESIPVGTQHGQQTLPILSALWLGILTSVSPCPLASNIAAVSFISRDIKKKSTVLWAGSSYIFGRILCYTALGACISASLVNVPLVSHYLQMYMPKVIGPLLVLTGIVLLDLIALPFSGFVISQARAQSGCKAVGHGERCCWGSYLPLPSARYLQRFFSAALSRLPSAQIPAAVSLCLWPWHGPAGHCICRGHCLWCARVSQPV